jgi:Calx-beta domain
VKCAQGKPLWAPVTIATRLMWALGGLRGWGAVPAAAVVATVTIRRIGETLTGANLDVRVPFRTVDRTADSPRDYKHTSGTLRFTPGQMQRNVKVPLRRDRRAERDESFAIELGPYATSGAVIVRESHTVRIVDND